MISRNPFVVGMPVPPDSFIGRTYEIAAAFDQIYNRSHLAIWGGPGMGKSSFLAKIAHPQTWKDYGLDSSNAVVVILSCNSLIPFTPASFWQEVLQIIHDKLDDNSQLQAEINTLLKQDIVTKDSLRQALRKLRRQKQYLVLLVDDFDLALQTNEQYSQADREIFLAQCRSLAVHAQERKSFSMIVTSLQRLNELGPQLNPNASPWYNHYLFQSLKLFTKEKSDELLTIIRPQQLRDAIQDITGGHPTLLQIAGFLVYRQLQPGQAIDIQKFADAFKRETNQIFATIWSKCNPEERTLLMLIVLLDLEGSLKGKSFNLNFNLKGIGLILTQQERAFTKLEEQGIIISTPMEDGKFYCFTSSSMKQWVIEEIWNTKEAELQNREKVFLNLMSHGQLQEVKKAINWMFEHKNDVISILEWFGKVVAAFPKGLI